MATHNYRFSCGNTRAAYSRLAADDQLLLDWSPEKIDWRHYLEVHGPGIQQNVNRPSTRRSQGAEGAEGAR